MQSDTLSPAKIADGEAILNYWIATEALTPKVFKDRRLDVEVPRRSKKGKLPTKAPIAYNSGQRDAVLPWLDPSMDPELRAIIAKSGTDEKEKRSVFWVLPLGFIDMKKASAALSAHFDALSDDDRERVREVSDGWACLGTACFDGAGQPTRQSVVLSSFGWACGEILSNRMDRLHQFPDLVENMCATLKDKLTAQHSKGYRISTRQREIQASKKELLKLFNPHSPDERRFRPIATHDSMGKSIA